VYAKAPSVFVGLLLLQGDEDVHDGCLGEHEHLPRLRARREWVSDRLAHGYVEWRGKIGFLKNNTRMLGT
jgi:hypothetical protein